MTLMTRGATWLGAKLKTAGGRTVRYRRGQASVELTLVTQMHNEPVINDGLPMKSRVHSWTLTAADLVLGGETVEPRGGDVIEEVLHGAQVQWEVVPKTDTQPSFEWMDEAKLLMIVHTKQVN